MTQITQPKLVLIVEPNEKLVGPYVYFDSLLYNCLRVSSLQLAKKELYTATPWLVCLSASFSAQSSLDLLTAIKDTFTSEITPIIFVVDLNQPTSVIPGTHWGKKLAILHSNSTKPEFLAAIRAIAPNVS